MVRRAITREVVIVERKMAEFQLRKKEEELESFCARA
jgi:hypothetical protein